MEIGPKVSDWAELLKNSEVNDFNAEVNLEARNKIYFLSSREGIAKLSWGRGYKGFGTQAHIRML